MDGLSDAEIRLAGIGLHLTEAAETFTGRDPDVIGAAAIVPETWEYGIAIPPGLSQEQRTLVAEWAEVAIPRFLAEGPELDGWGRRPTLGGWQLWLRQHVVSDELFSLGRDS